MQRDLVERRKRGEIPDQLLFVEHPHVITLGRNGRMENLLASEEVIRRAGISVSTRRIVEAISRITAPVRSSVTRFSISGNGSGM